MKVLKVDEEEKRVYIKPKHPVDISSAVLFFFDICLVFTLINPSLALEPGRP